MRKLVIAGGDGIGLIAADIARINGSHEIIGFLNDRKNVGDKIGRFKTYDVVGTVGDCQQLLTDPDVDIFIAYVGITDEKKTFEQIQNLQIPMDRRPTLIHPTAYFNEETSKIGVGVLMAPYSQLSPDVELEDSAILLANSFVGHNSTVGQHTHIATNAVVGGYVQIGKFCHIGSNSTIRENVKIGDFVVVGAGSVVLSQCGDSKIYAGNPARQIR